MKHLNFIYQIFSKTFIKSFFTNCFSHKDALKQTLKEFKEIDKENFIDYIYVYSGELGILPSISHMLK